MRALCAFLDEKTPDGYLQACSSRMLKAPRQTRAMVRWTASKLALAAKLGTQFEYLQAHAFEAACDCDESTDNGIAATPTPQSGAEGTRRPRPQESDTNVDRKETRVKLLFIAGLTHSGSTALDLLLGGHSQLVGLGEAATLVTQQPSKLFESGRLCSCGASLRKCVFWKHVLGRLETEDVSAPVARYRLLLDVSRNVFGDDTRPVDSSKSLSALRILASIPELELQVLHLIRDVRAWTISRLEVDRRQRRQGLGKVKAESGGRLWLYYLQQIPAVRFAIWHRGNRQLQRFFETNHVPALQIAYEQLTLSCERTVAGICAFAGLLAEPLADNMAATSSHVALGNPMRLDASRRTTVAYDHRWLARNEWVLASLLMPHVMAYNRAHVYAQWNGVCGTEDVAAPTTLSPTDATPEHHTRCGERLQPHSAPARSR